MKHALFFLIAIFFLVSGATAQRQKVILDCDLGGDIDDAFALALLLCSQDEFEILGICMDHGYTPGRGKIAAKILHMTGFDEIPVYLGRHTARIVGEDTVLAGSSPQMIWAAEFNKLECIQDQPAPDFILETLNNYPGEILIFTLGPVDNIADVLNRDPGALMKAKKVVSMFGSVRVGYGDGPPVPEANVYNSVEAGKKLMNSGADLLLAPLDNTGHVILNETYINAIGMRQSPLTDAISALYPLWYGSYKHAQQLVLYDAVAIGMVLWPELFDTEEGYIYVDDEGFTRIDKTKQSNCTFGSKSDDKEFIRRMFRRLVEQNFSYGGAS